MSTKIYPGVYVRYRGLGQKAVFGVVKTGHYGDWKRAAKLRNWWGWEFWEDCNRLVVVSS